MSDGTRTRDRLDHNQELYLLSYAHHAFALSGDIRNLAVGSGAFDAEIGCGLDFDGGTCTGNFSFALELGDLIGP